MSAIKCSVPVMPVSAAATEAQHALRLLHLQDAIRRWLGSGAIDRHHALGTLAAGWLCEAEEARLSGRFPALVARLQELLPAARARDAGQFESAFAAALAQQALLEVAREAARSGHAGAFDCLKPYLRENPCPADLEQLSQALAMTPQAIMLALGSLRRRLRGRMEAALDLWSDTLESRDALRRKMRAALTESSP